MDRLDVELDAALRVEPSPDFRAGVRTRIAHEPVAKPWWSRREFLMPMTMAAAAALVVMAIMPSRDNAGVQPETKVLAGRAVGDQSFGLQPAVSPRRPVMALGDVGSTRTMSVSTVLISETEAGALRRLLNAVPTEWPESLSGPAEISAVDEPPPDRVTIAPIAIAPIFDAGDKGVHQ